MATTRRPRAPHWVGCGTGTNAIYPAQRSWDVVVAIDLIGRAVDIAEERVSDAGVTVRLLHGDATRLDALDAAGRSISSSI